MSSRFSQLAVTWIGICLDCWRGAIAISRKYPASESYNCVRMFSLERRSVRPDDQQEQELIDYLRLGI